MPITTIQLILSTDKLQSGFRAKANNNFNLMVVDLVDQGDGTLRVDLQGGTNFQADLTTSFYTKTETNALISAINPAAWGAITGNVEDQTDVVGNLGVISPIDDILFSANFGVDAADPDNPFGTVAASGYSSFSVPATTGWQLLATEEATPSIKLRTYSGGVWNSWVDIVVSSAPVLTYDEGDLVESSPGSSDWYLEFTPTTGFEPFMTMITYADTSKTNNPGVYTKDTGSAYRQYGFTNNNPQTIKVYLTKQ